MGHHRKRSLGIRTCISIHPPREGWDPSKELKFKGKIIFQSTHPVRGGTADAIGGFDILPISIHPPREGWDRSRASRSLRSFSISIHPPREGWDATVAETAAAIEISIHPPREGWDGLFAFQGSFPARPFQSTHPVRGGTFAQRRAVIKPNISIHPPREGWDCC